MLTSILAQLMFASEERDQETMTRKQGNNNNETPADRESAGSQCVRLRRLTVCLLFASRVILNLVLRRPVSSSHSRTPNPILVMMEVTVCSLSDLSENT